MSIQSLAYETLHTTYQKTFFKVSMYATQHFLSHKVVEDALYNLYDILLQAQSDNVPVETIVGEDVTLFCKRYFDKPHFFESVYSLLVRTFFSILMIFCVEYLFLNIERPFNLGRALITVVIWIMWERVLLELSNAFFKQNDTTIALGVFSLVSILAIYTVVDIPQLTLFIPRNITMWLILIGGGITILIYKLLPSEKKKAQQYVKKLLKRTRQLRFYKDMLFFVRERTTKRYYKKLKKSHNLQWCDFIQTEKSRLSREYRFLKYTTVVFVIFCFFISHLVFKDTLQDAILFMLLNAIIGYTVLWFSVKGDKMAQKCFDELLKEGVYNG